MIKSIVIVIKRTAVLSVWEKPKNGEKMNNNMKKTINIGPFLAILIFFVILGTIPYLSLVSLAVGPVMVALIYHRAGNLYLAVAYVVTIILTGILINPLFALTITSLMFIIGSSLIYMVDKNKSALMNYIVLTLAIIAGYLVMTYVDIAIINNLTVTEYLATMVEQLKLSMVEITKIMQEAGGNTANNPAMNLFEGLTVNRLVSILPTIITFYALLAALVIYKIAFTIFKRMNIPLRPLPQISEIKANMALVLITLFLAMAGVLLVNLGVPEAEGMMLLGNNLFTLVGVVSGLSLFSYFMKTKLKYSTFFRVVILVLIAASRLVSVVMILGIIDSAFDFRTLRENGLYHMIKSKINSSK